MVSKGQITGMRGVYLVAAELSRRGFIASPTSGGAAGADILVTNHDCSATFSVQVKTNAKNGSFWLIGEKSLHIRSKTHIYVLVNIKPLTDGDSYDYFVVPSSVVCRVARSYERPNSTFHSVQRSDVADYNSERAWRVFGAPV